MKKRWENHSQAFQEIIDDGAFQEVLYMNLASLEAFFNLGPDMADERGGEHSLKNVRLLGMELLHNLCCEAEPFTGFLPNYIDKKAPESPAGESSEA